jgi:alpha-glucosidase
MEINAGISHKASQQRDWWRSAVIYQVYPRSFADGMESLRRSVAS